MRELLTGKATRIARSRRTCNHTPAADPLPFCFVNCSLVGRSVAAPELGVDITFRTAMAADSESVGDRSTIDGSN